jgi:hypothetical protein
MSRILIDLAAEDVAWLDEQAARQGKSRAAVLRDAVTRYREGVQAVWMDQFFGIWRDRAPRDGE